MNGELGLRNRQRTRRVDVRRLRRILEHLLTHHFPHEQIELGVHLVGAREMARVNAQFLQHTGSTDVITFDYRPQAGQSGRARRDPDPSLWGEILICVDDAVAQARQFHTTWPEEVTRYLIHGLLHLHGYDDRTPAPRRAMKREENRLLRGVRARFPLRCLARRVSTRRPQT